MRRGAVEEWFQNPVVAWAGVVAASALLIFCGLALPRSFKISGGHGTPGTYHVTGEIDCSGITSDCLSRSGTFSSDDGKVIRTSVRARLPKPVRHGDLRRTYDIGEDEVFVKTRRGWQIGWPISGSTVALVLLALGVQGLRTTRKRRGADAT
jgi:hypothetical protein